jgi:hypothetical protein
VELHNIGTPDGGLDDYLESLILVLEEEVYVLDVADLELRLKLCPRSCSGCRLSNFAANAVLKYGNLLTYPAKITNLPSILLQFANLPPQPPHVPRPIT